MQGKWDEGNFVKENIMLTFSYQVAEVNSAEEQEAVQREVDRRGYTRFGVRYLKELFRPCAESSV